MVDLQKETSDGHETSEAGESDLAGTGDGDLGGGLGGGLAGLAGGDNNNGGVGVAGAEDELAICDL